MAHQRMAHFEYPAGSKPAFRRSISAHNRPHARRHFFERKADYPLGAHRAGERDFHHSARAPRRVHEGRDTVLVDKEASIWSRN